MSSRLFQEIRERRGHAYSVYSFLSSFRDAGYLGIYVGTSAEWAREVVDVIQAELGRVARDGLGADELARAEEPDEGQHAARARDQRQPHEPDREERDLLRARRPARRGRAGIDAVTNDDIVRVARATVPAAALAVTVSAT